MKWKKIDKIHQGKFVTRYDITYETVDKREKVYEMISRNSHIKTQEDLYEKPADAVVLIMHNRENNKILLNKEFRLAVGEFVYNFPAGLIDAGEMPKESAKRELKEETGLDLVEIVDVIGESYSAVGFSNEKNVCILGIADGEFAPSTDTVEEIEAGWFTKEEVRQLLQKEKFAARTQAYCYMWSRE